MNAQIHIHFNQTGTRLQNANVRLIKYITLRGDIDDEQLGDYK